MNWTKDLPAKPGYYWVSLDIWPDIHELVEFWPFDNGQAMPPEQVGGSQHLCALYAEEHWPATNEKWSRYWFYGPIDHPPFRAE